MRSVYRFIFQSAIAPADGIDTPLRKRRTSARPAGSSGIKLHWLPACAEGGRDDSSQPIGSRLILLALLASPAMTKGGLIIQLIKIALGVAIGTCFVWWNLEALHRLPLHQCRQQDRPVPGSTTRAV